MNFLAKLFKSRPDVQSVFTGMKNSLSAQKLIDPGFSDDVISFLVSDNLALSTPSQLMDLATDPATGSQQLIYLAQLVADKIATINRFQIEISCRFRRV